MGCELCFKITIKDDRASITNTLEYLITQNLDYIITTGGLGPTKDDKTKDALNDFFIEQNLNPQKILKAFTLKKYQIQNYRLATLNMLRINGYSKWNLVQSFRNQYYHSPRSSDEMKTMMKKKFAT